MQATVKRWDPAAGRGSVLLDDGQELAFGGEALVGVRGLRLGQRVELRIEDGTVLALTLSTLPL